MPPRANISVELYQPSTTSANDVDSSSSKAFTGGLAAETTRRMIVIRGKPFFFGIAFRAVVLLGSACCWPGLGLLIPGSVSGRGPTTNTLGGGYCASSRSIP